MGVKKYDFLDEIFDTSIFLKNLSSATIKEISKILCLKNCDAGDTIIAEGSDNKSLFFLLEGTLGIYVHGQKVSELNRFGEVIGEISLISSSKASATVKSLTKSILLDFNLDELNAIAPEALEEFESSQFKLFSAILSERLVQTNEKARQFEITNRELIEIKEKLEKSNLDLEQRVAQRTEELNEKNKKLEQTVQENKQLVRVMCHDLNNTQAVVQMTTSKVLKSFTQLTPEQQLENWKRVERAAMKERDLINHIRDLTALESGKKELKLSSVDLEKAIENSLFLFNEKLSEKAIHLKLSLDGQALVSAEPVSLIHSVLNNLLSNAIKFTPRGRTIEIKGQSHDSHTYSLIIKDNGIGIPKDILNDLFSISKKTSRLGTEGEVGTGFGMPLVKATMGAYGGEIIVSSITEDESSLNSGTSFELIFQKHQDLKLL